MFIPLVDILRCPNAHEETWLVASIDRADDRDIVEGTLGCPICAAEYPIRDGIVDFGGAPERPAFRAADEHQALKLAAALDLTDARTVAVLHGTWGAHAPLIRSMSPSQLLLINPPEGVVSGDGVSIALAARAPLAAASVNAVALDAHADADMVASLVRGLRAGGRVLAPSSSPQPDGFTELARDEDVYVVVGKIGETATSPISISMRKDRRG